MGTDTDTTADVMDGGDAPAYNTVFKYAERAELAPLLKTLVHELAAPLRTVETTFATDSTGFATSTYARWFDEKYGAEKRCQRWIKLHAQVGTLTNVIASVEATESTVGDVVMLGPLLRPSVERGFTVQELDGAVQFWDARTIRRPAAVDTVAFASAGHDLVAHEQVVDLELGQHQDRRVADHDLERPQPQECDMEVVHADRIGRYGSANMQRSAPDDRGGGCASTCGPRALPPVSPGFSTGISPRSDPRRAR
jgi:hypothetical protein